MNNRGLLNKLYQYRKFQEGGVAMCDLDVGMADLAIPQSDLQSIQNQAVQSQAQGQFQQAVPTPIMSEKQPEYFQQFKDAVGQRESSGDYAAKNQLGYLGKYQFGNLALQDVGYKDKKGNWTGKNGVKSEEDFLLNPEAQEKAANAWFLKLKSYLKQHGALDKVGEKFQDIPVTESGLIAASHLVGAKAVAKMLKTGKIPVDGNGVPATEYMKKFENLDIRDIGDTGRYPQSLQPKFQEGGVAEGIPEINPLAEEEEELTSTYQPPVPQQPIAPKQDLLSLYIQQKKDYERQAEEARKKQALMEMVKGFGQAARTAGAGYAQMKTGTPIAPVQEQEVKIPTIEEMGIKKPATLEDALKLAEIKAKLKKGIGGTDAKYTPVRVKDKGEIRTKMVNIYDPSDTKDVGEAGYSSETMIQANKNIYDVTEDFEKHPMKKKLDEQGISFEQADALMSEIKTGNEIALGSLGTKMARAMGEVGVLTDTDVTRYIQAQSFLRLGKDYYARRKEGKLYNETMKEMQKVIDKMKSGFDAKRNAILSRYVNKAYLSFGKTAGLSKQEVYDRFGFGYAANETIRVRRKSDGMEKTLPKDQAEKLLKDSKFERVK